MSEIRKSLEELRQQELEKKIKEHEYINRLSPRERELIDRDGDNSVSFFVGVVIGLVSGPFGFLIFLSKEQRYETGSKLKSVGIFVGALLLFLGLKIISAG